MADLLVGFGYGGGMNLYAYVKGDPVNFTDPMGLDRNRPYEGLGGNITTHIVSEAKRIYDEMIIYDDWGSPFVYSPGSGNAALFELSTPETVESQSQQPEPPCTGFLGAVQDFTGGESNQAWYDDIADNFIDTEDTVASSLLSTGLSMAGASTTARSWGGVTLLQLGQQAWNANYGPVRTPGLWGFRPPSAALGTAAASWVLNAGLIQGAYNSGLLTGSLIRTGVNRAAGAKCARP